MATSDSFIQSFWQGLDMAHKVANDARVAQAQAMTEKLQSMQLRKMEQDLQQGKYIGIPQGGLYDVKSERVIEPLDKPPMSLENILADKVKRGEITLVDAIKMKKQQEAKEVNVANEIDTVLGGMFPGYYTKPEVRQKALDYYATPEGSAMVQKKAQAYTQGKAPAIYNIIPGYQTPQGAPIPYNVRNPQIPSNIQKAPSESDITAARTQTSISTVLKEIRDSFNLADKSLPKTATERVAGAIPRKFAVAAQTDTPLALADAMSQSFLAKFARAAGEVGTLTDRDVERASKYVPNIHDTKEVREGKLNNAEKLYWEIYNRGKRQENPLEPGNAPGSNIPPFDQPIGKKGGKRPSLDEIFKGK